MSKGIGGFCNKISESTTEVIYEYSSYNLNDLNFRNDKKITNGYIEIKKSDLPEPEIHEKIKKQPNGKKKLVIKKVPTAFSVEELVNRGIIYIENCSNTWETYDNSDIIALNVCRLLILEYQLNGDFPESQNFHV